MATSFSIALPPREEKLLRAAALRYGFSTDELMRRIIAEASQAILQIPEESLDEYENPQQIKRALRSALRAERTGKVLRSLPKRVNPRHS